jgi:hypothetical protein
VVDRSEGATTLLGMPEFVVGAQIEVSGEWWLAVETTAVVMGCEVCGTRAVGHGSRRGEGSRPADGGSPGGAGVGEAAVALP